MNPLEWKSPQKRRSPEERQILEAFIRGVAANTARLGNRDAFAAIDHEVLAFDGVKLSDPLRYQMRPLIWRERRKYVGAA